MTGGVQQAYQDAPQPAVAATQPQMWQPSQPAQPQPQPAQTQAAPMGVLFSFNTKDGSRSGIYMFCKTPSTYAAETAVQILSQNGFKPNEYKGESVYKKGVGLATAMQYVKLEPTADSLYVQGWVVMGIGDIGINEMDLDGVVGALPKKSLKKVLDKIQAAI